MKCYRYLPGWPKCTFTLLIETFRLNLANAIYTDYCKALFCEPAHRDIVSSIPLTCRVDSGRAVTEQYSILIRRDIPKHR